MKSSLLRIFPSSEQAEGRVVKFHNEMQKASSGIGRYSHFYEYDSTYSRILTQL